MPVLEYVHVAKGDVGVANLDVAALVRGNHMQRRCASGVALLHIVRHPYDRLWMRDERRGSPLERLTQSQIGNRHLAAGVDDRPGADAAHEGIDRQQIAIYQLKRNGVKASFSALIVRALNGDEVVAKVDQY